jgi:protein O-GlcNAc transferase
VSPIEIEHNLRTAVRLLQARQLAPAEALFRGILAQHPDHHGAMHWLGVVALQGQRADVAADYLARACALEPTNAGYHCNLGLALQSLGKLTEAVTSFARALERKPDFAEAHNNLGIALMGLGQRDQAITHYRRALELKPGNAEGHNNLGNALHCAGHPAEAVTSYHRALQLKPDYAEAHYNLGIALKAEGKTAEAIACYRIALELQPDYAEAHNNLGLALYDRGQLEEAIVCYRRALELKPGAADAHNNLGNALKDRGQLADAAACYRRALAQNPAFVEALNNLGNALKSLGTIDDAVACYRSALALKLDYAEAHTNLGAMLHEQGKLGEATTCHQKAVALQPNNAEAHSNLGNAYRDQGQLDAAVACYRRALELKPECAAAHNNLADALKHQGRLDEAAACYLRAAQLEPDNAAAVCNLIHHRQLICQWDDVMDLSRRVIQAVDAETEGGSREGGSPVPPFQFLALPAMTTPSQQLRCARRWARAQSKLSRPAAIVSPTKNTSKITVGYLSADFQAHATAILFAELFEKHDRSAFEVIGYSYGPDDGSPMRRRLMQAFDRFVDIKNISYGDAAGRIIADGVDILVDLQGYTGNARTAIVAARPAPIQVNFLGYPGTMGAPYIDYILVDDFIVPSDQQPFFAENLVHLPGCYQVNDSRRAVGPETPSRAECGLPEEGFVFCSFNNNYKITAEVFAVWMRLLGATPGSVLWLLEGNRFAPANLRREAEARGIAPERLVFAPRRPAAEHLARHRQADLFLDTIPYNAHVTASDALWVGCPLLTIAGATFASRVAGSLLRAVALPELITTSLAEYEALALKLAGDSRMLGELRARLAVNRLRAAVFRAEPFARNLENAYATMWRMHAAGEKPRPFAVTPLS